MCAIFILANVYIKIIIPPLTGAVGVKNEAFYCNGPPYAYLIVCRNLLAYFVCLT